MEKALAKRLEEVGFVYRGHDCYEQGCHIGTNVEEHVCVPTLSELMQAVKNVQYKLYREPKGEYYQVERAGEWNDLRWYTPEEAIANLFLTIKK